MNSELETVISEVRKQMQADFGVIRTKHAELVGELAAEVDAVGVDNCSDDIWDEWDKACDHYAAIASNQLADVWDRQTAITAVEEEMSELINRDTAADFAVIAIWGYGIEKGADAVRSALGVPPTSEPGSRYPYGLN